MKRPALVTTRRRVTWAALYGVAAPTVLFVAAIAVRDFAANPSWVTVTTLIGTISFGVPIFFGLSGLVFAVFGVPLWLLLHRRQARWPLATLCGGALGPLVVTAILLSLGLADRIGSGPFREIMVSLPFIVGAGVIGALTGLGVWLIAYRPAPTPTKIADAFA